MAHLTERRVVITGLGVVAPNGIGKEAFWYATSRGISGIKSLQRFSASALPIQVGGEVSNFVVHDYIERKLVNRTDRMTHFAFIAVQEALPFIVCAWPTLYERLYSNSVAAGSKCWSDLHPSWYSRILQDSG